MRTLNLSASSGDFKSSGEKKKKKAVPIFFFASSSLLPWLCARVKWLIRSLRSARSYPWALTN